MSKADQYTRAADSWSDDQYADSDAYLAHRADLVIDLGPPLRADDEVLDLACGDGGLGATLVERGLRYRGVDATPEMVAAARKRLGDSARVEIGNLNEYVPPAPVAATTVFRAIYYAADRRSFFGHAASYTTSKLVLDLNPRQYRLDEVVGDLRAAGFGRVETRPFFVPQTRALPAFVGAGLRAAETVGPLARLALRYRFTLILAAFR
jgi:SAM-dependent methyltransferase